MKSFEELGRELERRGKTEDIKRIAESEDGQKLGRMVDASDVERAASRKCCAVYSARTRADGSRRTCAE